MDNEDFDYFDMEESEFMEELESAAYLEKEENESEEQLKW